MNTLKAASIAVAMVALPQVALSNSLGSYEAVNDPYVIFGSVDGQLQTGNSISISYNASSATSTGNATNENNIIVDGGSTVNNYDALTEDASNAIAFVQDGTVGIRANGAYSLVLQMPMAKVGTSCVPVFSASTASASVSAYMGIVLWDGSTTVESYISDNKTGTTSSANVTVDCSGATSAPFIDSTGTITFAITPDGTTEYGLELDIGFEVDGSFTTDGSSATPFGDNGEPVADTYTLGLVMTASL